MQLRNVERGLTYADIAFIHEALGAGAPAEDEMTQLLADEEHRARLLGDSRLFDTLLPHDGSLAPVSPRLFFEALLRHAVTELQGAQHTFERTGSRSGERVPVFDAAEVAAFAAQPRILHYLAALLSSFTKVHSHTERVWVRRGVVRKVRYSDLDVHSMLRLIPADRGARAPAALPAHRRPLPAHPRRLPGLRRDRAPLSGLRRASGAVIVAAQAEHRGVRDGRGGDVRPRGALRHG